MKTGEGRFVSAYSAGPEGDNEAELTTVPGAMPIVEDTTTVAAVDPDLAALAYEEQEQSLSVPLPAATSEFILKTAADGQREPELFPMSEAVKDKLYDEEQGQEVAQRYLGASGGGAGGADVEDVPDGFKSTVE